VTAVASPTWSAHSGPITAPRSQVPSPTDLVEMQFHMRGKRLMSVTDVPVDQDDLGRSGQRPSPIETPSPEPMYRLARHITSALVSAGFEPHLFLGTEETVDEWRRRGPLTVIRPDHIEVWWSAGPRPSRRSGPTDAEWRMTPVLRDILSAAGIRAELSIPTGDGDSAVWVADPR
jgi:hypothetical protein